MIFNTAPHSFRGQFARRLARETINKELATQPNLVERVSPAFSWDPPLPRSGGPCNLSELPRPQETGDSNDPGSFKFCIIGAGVAGLHLAMLLSRVGIPYDLLEASDRVGGRLYTKKLSEEKYGYYDIGAMRYPDIPWMKKTLDLIDYLKVNRIPYQLSDHKCPKMYNDILGPIVDPNVVGVLANTKDSDRDRDPDPYRVSESKKGVVPDKIVEAGADKILEKAFLTCKKTLEEAFKVPIQDENNPSFRKLLKLDRISTREFLRSHFAYGGKIGLDFHSIQWLETNTTSSGLFDQSFLESAMDYFDFGYPGTKWYCIDGGSTKIIDAMLTKITTKPEINTNVIRIALERDGENESNNKVSVGFVDPNGQLQTRKYDTVFNTTTLACAQRMNLTGAELHPAQKDALRVLHYDASSKVAILFKTPWWITKCGITKGGTASTDLPLRTCVYPSYNLEQEGHDKPAVLLASYTWAQDAQRIASLIKENSPEKEKPLKELLLRDLARLHERSGIDYKFLKEQYITHHAFDWHRYQYTSGAFALFGPGQFSGFYTHLTRPAADSRLHFVGEASSIHHAWVVGALESAETAFKQAMFKHGLFKSCGAVEEFWGMVEKEQRREVPPIEKYRVVKEGVAKNRMASDMWLMERREPVAVKIEKMEEEGLEVGVDEEDLVGEVEANEGIAELPEMEEAKMDEESKGMDAAEEETAKEAEWDLQGIPESLQAPQKHIAQAQPGPPMEYIGGVENDEMMAYLQVLLGCLKPKEVIRI